MGPSDNYPAILFGGQDGERPPQPGAGPMDLPPLSRSEQVLIRDRLESIWRLRKAGREELAQRHERRFSEHLRRFHLGRCIGYLGYAWTVDERTPAGKIKRTIIEEID